MLIPKLELNKTQTLRCGLNNPRKAAWCAPGYLTKPTPRAARPGRQRAALTWARAGAPPHGLWPRGGRAGSSGMGLTGNAKGRPGRAGSLGTGLTGTAADRPGGAGPAREPLRPHGAFPCGGERGRPCPSPAALPGTSARRGGSTDGARPP